MTELEKLYRQAPRQSSPNRLDEIVLTRAAQKVTGKKRPLLVMTPLKTLAVSFSVAGLGVALLLRYGVPPLEQNLDNFDRGIAVEAELAKNSAPKFERNPVENSDAFSNQAAELAADTSLAEVEQAPLTISVVAEDSVELAEAPTPLEAESTLPEPFSAELASEDKTTPASQLNNRVAVASSQVVTAESVEITEPFLAAAPPHAIDSPADRSVADGLNSFVTSEESAPVNELAVAQSSMASNARQNKKLSRMSALPKAQPAELKQSARTALSVQKAVIGVNIVAPPDSAEWVVNQSEQSFTLQLASASSLSYLQDYADSLDLMPPFYIVALATNTEIPNFGLLYGLFENVQQALDMIETLPDEARKFRPWVRRLGKLQNEVLLP